MQLRSLLAATAVVACPALAQSTTTLEFEASGLEAGITTPGASAFTAGGSDWSGGVVQTQFVPPLYSSGGRSYMLTLGSDGEVHFHDSIDRVRLFFVHGFGVPSGQARFFDAAGNQVGVRNSKQATIFGDPANFVTIQTSGIVRVEFTGGAVDSFEYRTEDDCAPSDELCGDRHVLRLTTGGTQDLAVDLGAALANDIGIVVGSLTGTSPPLVLDGVDVPIAFDVYTSFLLASPTAPVGGTFLALDGDGRASTSFGIPTGMSPSLAGLVFTHAVAGFSMTSLTIVAASNPETVTLAP